MNSLKERPLQASRRASSCPLKGMFSTLEEPLLQPWRAYPRKEKRVVSEISLQFLKIQSAFFLTEGAFYFSQKNTEEQISQRCTETLSQPITQSVSANDGCNVLWYIAITLCDICRLLAGVCVFPLFAERLLSFCENLWEMKHPTSLIQDNNLCRNWSHNVQRIKHLQTRIKKGLVNDQEGRLQHARRACSGTMKSLLSKCIECILF